MTLPQRLSLAPERRRRLVNAARGKASPDAVVLARAMLDIYTGRADPAEVGMAEGRIAWLDEIGTSGCPRHSLWTMAWWSPGSSSRAAIRTGSTRRPRLLGSSRTAVPLRNVPIRRTFRWLSTSYAV